MHNLDLFGAMHSKPEAGAIELKIASEAALSPQLDLFVHTPVEQALRRTKLALILGDVAAARAELAQLCADPAAASRALNDAQDCMVLVAGRETPPADAVALLDRIDEQLGPAAVRFIGGTEADALINSGLRLVAVALRGAAFDPRHPRAYAASLWFALGDFRAAKMALEADANWSQCAQRLLLHARIAEAMHDRTAALRDWQMLCWQYPVEAERALPTSALLGRQWDEFCGLDVVLEVELFPVWSQLQRLIWPSMASADGERPEAALMRISAALARAPTNVALRRQLHALEPQLLHAWLAKH